MTLAGQGAVPEGKCTVYGRVVDAQSGKPLMLVNVFLANTMIGTTTDREGFYRISTVPIGSHELVVSMMGYKVQTVPLRFAAPSTMELNFRLEPRVLQLPAVEVEAPRAKDWERNLSIFTREFLGQTANAQRCRIINPEYLDFAQDKESGVLTATASEALEIVNEALGYRITTVLLRFTFGHGRCEYVVKPIFEELAARSQQERKEWTKRRLEAYRGSFRHFYQALVGLRLSEEGFAAGAVRSPSERAYFVYLGKEALQKLFSPGDFPGETKLHFGKYLQVVYYKESDEFSFAPAQTSCLEALTDTVIVYEPGYTGEEGVLVRYGRWARDRMAEALPFDYLPEEK
ncbi:MAG: carboxypeptidase-like regulatory domain-containing protein [bacterium]|nr:carboxypeptidase-like regulatory domain-containing protein [candidate division KSB1 bacterium]MDH7559423.1 carboxypeptidase-like regulatory domain-containing protein [bacterium]